MSDRREYLRQYYEAHREAIVEWKRRYREANREAIVEKDRRYREANRERLAEKARQYHKANREEVAEQQRQYREANRDYQRAMGAARYRASQAETGATARRAGSPWTAVEDAQVLETLELPMQAVAHSLGRTYASVDKRRRRLRKRLAVKEAE